MEKQYDYVVVGQGLAGTTLSLFLLQKGKRVIIVDAIKNNSSSQVAAGLFNPVTGRRVVKSWMADELLPFSENFYKKKEEEWEIKFYHRKNILEIVHSIKEQNDWSVRMGEPEMKKYLAEDAPENIFLESLSEFKKMFRIRSSGWLDIPAYTVHARSDFMKSQILINETFDFSKLKIESERVSYEGINAKGIIFCEGFGVVNNPFWKWVPLVPAKGEILTIECSSLPEEFILMSGIFLIPLGNHQFRTGSTFEWNFVDENPSEFSKNKIIDALTALLKVDFKIIDHQAGVRPTVKDRRPLLGNHPIYKNIYIFNGHGTKGVQLAPYFANQMVNYLVEDDLIYQEVNISRYYELYSKE